MDINSIDEEHTFYVNIFMGTVMMEKVIVAPFPEALEEMISDYYADYSLYHALSLQQCNLLIEQMRNNADKHLAIVYSSFVQGDDHGLSEEVHFVDDIKAFKKLMAAQGKVVLDETFIVRAIRQIHLCANNDDVIFHHEIY